MPPCVAVKVRAEGLRLMVGAVAAMMVRVTGTVLGVFDAPLAVMVSVAV